MPHAIAKGFSMKRISLCAAFAAALATGPATAQTAATIKNLLELGYQVVSMNNTNFVGLQKGASLYGCVTRPITSASPIVFTDHCFEFQ
jgi:ABC-type sugar transport system substrate-binding protein